MPYRSLIVLFALLTIPAGHAGAQALDDRVESLVAAVEPKVIEWRRDFHEHPELSNREFRTAAKVAEHLTSLGIDVQTEVAHTGVVGLLHGGRPGPVVLLRADMDGLPVTERVDLPFASRARGIYNGEEVGVMHACGHDTHVAILMGVAEVLSAIREDIPGTVKFIFQPAEEGAPEGEEGGAELMVREGILTNPDVDVAFALHIWSKGEAGHIFYTPGATYASADDFRIVVRGKQTHGASPWDGVDPIVTSAQIVTSLQTIVSRQMKLTDHPSVVTIGKISGGVRFNIIPEEVEMLGTVRTLDMDHRDAIHEKIRRIASNVAESMGATADVQIPLSTFYPVTYNDPDLTAEMVPVLEAAAGPGRLHLRKPVMGAEDFSFIAQQVPGLYINLGGRPPEVAEADAAPHHTPDFYIDESGLITGVRAMTALALHFLETRSASIGAAGR
jgi:amidohydrolase